MKRTTIYLEPDIELLLERETARRRVPMATLIREAIRAYLPQQAMPAPPGAGAFESGHRDTATDAEGALRDLGFGEPR
jgi:hypothetical protein